MPMAKKSAGLADRHDALDDYDVDEVFQDPFASPPPAASGKKRKSDDAELGIDKEVDVQKRARVPRVKLDEDRLLSDAGIPKLRRRAQGLKLKGKGHEFSDMTRLLTLYQLWLDDLFPKARFLDALAMVEKAGHKKRLVQARDEWLNERNPRPRALPPQTGDDDPFGDPTADFNDDDDGHFAAGRPERPGPGRLIHNKDTPRTPPPPPTPGLRSGHPDDEDEDDLYGVTPRAGPKPGLTMLAGGSEVPGDEDDLDALMAETEAQDALPATGSIFGNTGAATASKPSATDWDDDEAALREMEGF